MEVSALKPNALAGLRGPGPLLRLQSDERLIALTRRGQHAAFETLFSRYQSRLLAFCRHMLGSREDAEDVLQEVFVAAFNAILADEREINVRPWLYRIARNRSLNHLRRASAVGVDSMDIHYAEHGLSTSDKVLRRESFRQLIADVRLLPETQRTALLLREIDALSYEQIAITMETTVPSVKSLLVRARISLAEAAEARRLSCEEVRHELGEVAEGLAKLSAPVRRHVRECERCRLFRKDLKDNNRALAAILPVGPMLLLKKLIFTKLGSTASAGGATAGAAGAAGAGSVGMGGLATAGAGALATKAAATLAAAALVTAGAVEAGHVSGHARHPHHAQVAALSTHVARAEPAQPVLVRSSAQPVSTAASARRQASLAATRAARHARKPPPRTPTAATDVSATVTTTTAATTPANPTPVKTTAEPRPPAPPVTQVTTETTQLPSTGQPQPSAPVSPEATPAPPAVPEPSEPTPTPAPPPPPPAEAPPTPSTPSGVAQPGAPVPGATTGGTAGPSGEN
ncbi:MAG TPA: RNA polymerase sigma factor [Solirubrobacteraceae bacterium]